MLKETAIEENTGNVVIIFIIGSISIGGGASGYAYALNFFEPLPRSYNIIQHGALCG